MPGKKTDLLKCSFCGKTQKEVHKLIAGPGVFICDECTYLCIEIIVDEADAQQGPPFETNEFLIVMKDSPFEVVPKAGAARVLGSSAIFGRKTFQLVKDS